MTAYSEIRRELGTDHKDFLRLLPKAVPDAQLDVSGDEMTGRQIVISGAQFCDRIEIDLSAVGERRIALLCLPVTHAVFRFFGLDSMAAEAEYSRMAKTFQRGGG